MKERSEKNETYISCEVFHGNNEVLSGSKKTSLVLKKKEVIYTTELPNEWVVIMN